MNRTLMALVAALALFGCDPDKGTPGPTPAEQPAPEQPAPEQPAPETPEAPAPERPEPETPEAPAPETPPEAERPAPTPVGAEMTDDGAAELAPTPAPWMPTERARRRMNVDQLNAAFRRASGGIGWEERRGNNTVDLFEDLARTLGKPDYIQVTTEALEPSALFQKFLDDAARSVCAARIEQDQARGATPVVLPGAEVDVDAQLQALLLRFHGRDVELDSPDLAHWRWLFDSVAFVSADEITPWNAVCVGLYTHPDFYSY